MKITLLEKAPDCWRLRIEQPNEFGNRSFKYETVHGSKATAEARAEAIRRGATIKSAQVRTETFGEYLLRWVEDRRAYGHISDSTAELYARTLAPICKLIGHKPLPDVSRKDIDALYRTLVRNYGASRTRDMSVQMRKALREAASLGLVVEDPSDGVPVPRSKRITKTITLTPDQMAHLVERSKGWGDLGPLVRFALATGCRRGEICGLQWQDVNLDKGTVQIKRNVGTVGYKARVGTTKTATSNRVIALPKSMRDELAELAGNTKPTDWVFPNPLGQLRHPNVLSNQVARHFAAIGLDDFSLHDLRHAHATFLLQQKLPLKAVSQRLGHADVRITLGIYTHVMPGDDEHLASAINSIL
jgi:integrase